MIHIISGKSRYPWTPLCGEILFAEDHAWIEDKSNALRWPNKFFADHPMQADKMCPECIRQFTKKRIQSAAWPNLYT